MDGFTDDFYESRRWDELRQSILRRDRYVCQYYKRYGRLVEAQLVHHIFPRLEFPEYQYERWNLISVSRKAHNLLHDRDTDELTETGRDMLIRTARKNNIPIPDKYTKPIEKKHGKSRGLRRERFGYMEYRLS